MTIKHPTSLIVVITLRVMNQSHSEITSYRRIREGDWFITRSVMTTIKNHVK